jgi:hypothetical protein
MPVRSFSLTTEQKENQAVISEVVAIVLAEDKSP